MKKNLLLFICLCFCLIARSQDIDKAAALRLVSKNSTAIGLTINDLNNIIVSDAYTDRSTGLDMLYLQQSYKGLPIFNQLMVLAFKKGLPVSVAGNRIPEIENITAGIGETATVSAENAVRTAMAGKKIVAGVPFKSSTIFPGKKFDFGKMGVAYENVTAELMWVPLQDGKEVRLCWQVYLVPKNSSDYWMIRVDAHKNKVVGENNLTVYCDWSDPAHKASATLDHVHRIAPVEMNATSGFENIFDFTKYAGNEKPAVNSPVIINSASYKVIPLPAESPRHPGGAPALVTDPWNAAPGNASSLKWHSNGTTDFNITRGNNVWAKEDHAGNNSTAGQPATSTTPDPLTFNFTPDFTKQPNQTAPVPNQQFNITNIFYWVNIVHDVMYQYGFDEPAGNFQANNQGRGGAAGDFIFADAQDGNFIAPNQNNANFATPADGGSGRMQMYLWDTAVTLKVNSPATVARVYTAIEGSMSTANKLINLGPRTGQVVRYNDNPAGTTHEACGAPANSLSGKIALIDRGNCTFVIKVKNAQLAGAIGVIMVNNVAGLLTMAGDDNSITIPAVCISQADGSLFDNQIANNLNVTLSAANMDGDVDNGIIVHEHGHGISNRLTGGPSQAGCLSNAENMGEGWSDYYCLMFTQNWATSDVSSGLEFPRAIGTYAIGQVPGGTGIRTQPYTTDFGISNLVYAASIDPESHNRGELWCATLWDMTWGIINQLGTIDPNIYNATGNGGNTIALRLVTQGMKLQPCSPGFLDGRNAILQADQVLYGGAYSCVIKEAFRKRGMGPNAVQGSSNSVTDQVADFTVAPCVTCSAVTTVTQPAGTTACTGNNASFSVAVTGTTPSYQWQVSTNGGTSFTNIAGQTAATLTLTGVTAAMNNNQYKVVISNTCPSTVTSNPAILTVNDPAAITAQPAAVTACSGNNANFSVTATGTGNTYQWQVSTDGGVSFTNIAGATTTSLTLNAVTAALNGNQYQVVISSCSPGGLTSVPVTLTVNSAVAISAQPASTSACTGGGDATFSVTATGSALSYQWQVSTNGGTSFTNIAGATNASLTVTGITQANNNNVYQVVISNSCAAVVTSSQAVLTVSDPASIITQPTGTTVCAGAAASFTVATAGSGVTYQWQVSTDGGLTFANIAGATAAALNLTGITGSMNNNQYHVLVFSCNPAGLSSNNITLQVNSPVAVTTAPSTSNACVGANATFSVAAAGTANTYQWQVSTNGGTTFTNIPGATNSTLQLTGVTAAMNNNVYEVSIANSCTPVPVTASAALTVSNTASVITQPVNVTACAGTNAVFTASATGAAYQWQQSTDGGGTFTDIPGANSTTLTLPAVTASMTNNQYQLVIQSCGAATVSSTQVTLTVTGQVAISAQPVNNTACVGANATFTVAATGPAATYQWSMSSDGGVTFTPIAGATNATVSLAAVTEAMSGNQYQVTVSNSCTPGVVSNAGILSVSPLTAITSETPSVTACEADGATFSIQTASAANATYQWQVSTDAGANFSNVAGANGPALTLNDVTAQMNNNQYHVTVTGCGSVQSNNLVLTVNPLPVVSITAAPYLNLTTGSSTTLTATAVPAATAFTWYQNGVLLPSLTSGTINVSHNDLGDYNAFVVDDKGCGNRSNVLTIGDSLVNLAFIYPNPNNGFFQVSFENVDLTNKARLINIYDAKGSRVFSQSHVAQASYEIVDVHAEKLSKGVYVVVLLDASGNTLGSGKVLIK